MLALPKIVDFCLVLFSWEKKRRRPPGLGTQGFIYHPSLAWLACLALACLAILASYRPRSPCLHQQQRPRREAPRRPPKAAGVVVAWCRQGERGRNEAMDSQARQGQPTKLSQDRTGYPRWETQDWMGYPGWDTQEWMGYPGCDTQDGMGDPGWVNQDWMGLLDLGLDWILQNGLIGPLTAPNEVPISSLSGKFRGGAKYGPPGPP